MIEVKTIKIFNIKELQNEIDFFCRGRKLLNVQVFQDFKMTSGLTLYPCCYVAVVTLEKVNEVNSET